MSILKYLLGEGLFDLCFLMAILLIVGCQWPKERRR